MKNIFLLLLILINLNLLSQECDIDQWVFDNYSIDARVLAIREILKDKNHLYKDSIEVPDAFFNHYLGIFSSIFSQESEYSDTVFNIKQIHVLNRTEPVTEMVISVDTTKSWIKSMLLDTGKTGNQFFDSIMSQYHFTMGSFSKTLSTVFYHSPLQLNAKPLASILANTDGIKNIYGHLSWSIDGTEIQSESNGDTAIITFMEGWGSDCIRGCNYHWFWDFKVVSCDAFFYRSYDPYQPYSVLQENIKEFTVFPNPFEDKLFLPKDLNTQNVNIYTLRGELIFTFNNIKDYIDLSFLKTGTYIIEFRVADGIKTLKIVRK